MDFTFTAEQESLKKLAQKAFAERRDPAAIVAEAERAGLFGVSVPSEHGGAGLGFLETCLVLEQLGRAAAPVQLGAALVGAAAVARFGAAELARRWLPDAAAGTGLLVLALGELLGEAPLRAARTGQGWRLDGVVGGVPLLDRAARLVVAARVGDEPALFLVDPKAAGVTAAAQLPTDESPLSLLTFAGAEVAEADLLAPPGRAAAPLAWIDARARVALCAVELGIAQAQLALIAEHVVRRQQFGKPIGTFQAVAQRAADCYIDVETLRLCTWQAAHRLAHAEAAPREVEVAAFWAAEAGARVALAAQHLHGGIGFDRGYPLYRYFLAAKQLELTLGGANQSLAALGALLAGADGEEARR